MRAQKEKSQFMHLELYSRQGNSSAGKTSTGGVVNEAVRVPGFTDHIIADGYEPEPPTYLYSVDGKKLDQHYDDILNQVAAEKDSLGRKIKSDKNILLTGVVSYPKPRLADNWTDDDRQNYELFKEQSVDFMKEQWGNNLLCVLEHTDEQYLHLHFYIANKNRIASTPELHPGHAENIRLENMAKVEGKPVNKKEQVNAYKDAMRKFQDSYYEKVGVHCGFDRLGPKAQRMNRNEWRARKKATKLLAKAFKKVKGEAFDLNSKSTALAQSMLELEQQISEVMNYEVKLQNEHKQIEDGLKDLELAKFVRENYKDIVAKFNIEKIREESKKWNNKTNMSGESPQRKQKPK